VLDFNVLRSATSFSEFQQLAGFLSQHSGSLDNFLWQDPEDNSVTDHGFGVGDGVTTAFRLQRALLGGVYDVYGGPWPRSSKPRTNLCIRSEQLDDAAWTATNVAVFANATVAPDGNPTADQVTATGGGAITHRGESTAVSVTSGLTYTLSVFAKVAPGSPYTDIELQESLGGAWAHFELSNGTVGSVSGGTGSIIACGNGWFRCALTFVAGSTSTTKAYLCPHSRNGYVAASASDYFWGAQVEAAASMTQYIPTTSAAVTTAPAYWSAIGDGFEPVFDLNGPISVFIDNDWQGKRQLVQTARTNLCFFSQAPTDASWTKTTLTDNGAVADPSGASNARSYTSTATATAALSRSVAGLTAGYQYTASVWLRCAAGGTVKIGTTEGSSATLNVTSTWQRFTWTFNAAGASTTLTLGGSSTWANTQILEVYGFQLEIGAAATSYITTVAAAVTVTDIASIVSGLVTFSAAPAANAVLSWTGSYWRRVRFETDSIPMDRIVQAMWEAKQVTLISVKGTGVSLVGTPVIPAPMLGANSSAGQSITNGTTPIIVFGTVERDSDSAYNASTGRWTCPTGKDGDYEILGQAGYGTAPGGLCTVQIFKNAASIKTAQRTGPAANDTMLVSAVLHLVGGDIIDIRTSHGNVGAQSLIATAADVFFAIKRLPD
jgi:hypothetical protein